MAAMASHDHGIVEETRLPPIERAHEALLMGLRLSEGIDAGHFERRTGIALSRLVSAEARQRLVRHGLIESSGHRLAVTPAGMLVLNAVIAELAGDACFTSHSPAQARPPRTRHCRSADRKSPRLNS